MAKEDFALGLLQGLYASGVGNPEVQERKRNQMLQEAYYQRAMDKDAAEMGMVRDNSAHPETGNIVNTILNGLFPGRSGLQKSFQGYKQDPNAPSGYVSPKGEFSTESMQGSVRLSPQETKNFLVEKAKISSKSKGEKAPSGFRWTLDGGLEAIPGGPADFKMTKEKEKADNLKQGAIRQADRIIGKVDQALNKISWKSTGLGSMARWIPGTQSKNLAADLLTIKANLGFAELQEMRRQSPTGGALGQVAVQELDALQSTIASLDQEQDEDQLRERLGEVKKHYENWKTIMDGGIPDDPSEDQLAIEWAKKNPQDPRAERILKVNGF